MYYIILNIWIDYMETSLKYKFVKLFELNMKKLKKTQIKHYNKWIF